MATNFLGECSKPKKTKTAMFEAYEKHKALLQSHPQALTYRISNVDGNCSFADLQKENLPQQYSAKQAPTELTTNLKNVGFKVYEDKKNGSFCSFFGINSEDEDEDKNSANPMEEKGCDENVFVSSRDVSPFSEESNDSFSHEERGLTQIINGFRYARRSASMDSYIVDEHVDRSSIALVYIDDHFHYMLSYEKDFYPMKTFLDVQLFVKMNHRSKLIDWICQLAHDTKMSTNAFHIAVTVVDRVLAKSNIPLNVFQLMGCVSAFIASKFEDVNVPKLSSLMEYVEDHSRSEFKNMEILVLEWIEHRVMIPTSWWFAQHLLKLTSARKLVYCLTRYLVELASLDFKFNTDFKPSLVGFAAFYIANRRFEERKQGLMDYLFQHTGITEEMIIQPTQRLLDLFHRLKSDEECFIVSKYATAKYCRVSQKSLPYSLSASFGEPPQ